jgi:hypothetical protein
MVTQQLLANVDTNIKFFRRNRILLGASLFYLVITGLTLIPGLIFMSATKQFDIVKMLHDSLSTAVTICTALMGLLFMASHFRNRNVKMVLTKPCTPETWVAGLLVAAGAISLALHLVVVAITSIMFVAWGIPFQPGLIFVTLQNYLGGLIVLGFVVFLATSMPPVLAAIVAVIANEGTIYMLRTIVAAGIEATGSAVLSGLDKALHVAYVMLPSYSLFQERGEVESTWRVESQDWLMLAPSVGYTIAITAFFYLLTLAVLRRKSLG